MEQQQSKPKTVNVTINGKPIQANAGTTVFQAAADNGVFIPHYCYHQDLSIAGVCRMCVVDVEKNPKMQISCNLICSEGMVVHTNTPKVKEAVKSALELHLINHPLDCPICDKAGECKLQDFYRDFGLYESRMDFGQKVHKPKVVDIGTIVLDSERCILCTRCVRFTAEVTKTNEFGIFNRGDRSELRTYDNGPLRNEYTGNLADICPVGALTAKDFRFQCRVWFLDKTKSVCTFCARGCNTQVSVNPTTRTLYRVEPRRNPEVNSSWICDMGRWEYHHVSDDKRIKTPSKKADGQTFEATWEHAFATLNEAITGDPKKVLVAISTQATNEEIADAVTTLSAMGVANFTWLVDENVVDAKKPYDDILKHRDLTPNAAGFEMTMSALQKPWKRLDKLKGDLQSGHFDWVVCLGVEGHRIAWVSEFLAMIPAKTRVAVHTTSHAAWEERVEWMLPNTSGFEKSGTVINALGRIQKVNSALAAQHTSRDIHAAVFGIARGNDREKLPLGRAQSIFETVIIEKLLMGNASKWKGFNPMGISLKGEGSASENRA